MVQLLVRVLVPAVAYYVYTGLLARKRCGKFICIWWTKWMCNDSCTTGHVRTVRR